MSRVSTWAGCGALVLGAVLVGTWTAGEAPAETSMPPEGRRLFLAKGCASCHTGPDSTLAGDNFPPLDEAADWAGDRQAGVVAADYLAQSMVAPDAFISPLFRRGSAGPANGMPTLTLTAEEVDSLVDYLLAG